jgi:hypothetical protein
MFSLSLLVLFPSNSFYELLLNFSLLLGSKVRNFDLVTILKLMVEGVSFLFVIGSSVLDDEFSFGCESS